MYAFNDFSLTHYLDSLAAEYEQKGYSVDYRPFTYNANFLPIAATETAQTVVTIDHDSDFLLGYQTLAAFDAQTSTVIQYPNLLARIIVETQQRQLQNERTHVVNLFGTAERPWTYYKPALFSAKSSFTVELQNLTATPIDARFSFHGAKVILRPKR